MYIFSYRSEGLRATPMAYFIALGYVLALWLMHRSLVLAYTRLIFTILRGEYVLTILGLLTLFSLLLYLIFF